MPPTPPPSRLQVTTSVEAITAPVPEIDDANEERTMGCVQSKSDVEEPIVENRPEIINVRKTTLPKNIPEEQEPSQNPENLPEEQEPSLDPKNLPEEQEPSQDTKNLPEEQEPSQDPKKNLPEELDLLKNSKHFHEEPELFEEPKSLPDEPVPSQESKNIPEEHETVEEILQEPIYAELPSEVPKNKKKEGISAESSGMKVESAREIQIDNFKKKEETRELIMRALKENEFLNFGLDSKESMKSVVDAMYFETVPAGVYVITEGESGRI